MYGTISEEWKSLQDRFEGLLIHCFQNEPPSEFRLLMLKAVAKIINDRREEAGLALYTSQDLIDLVEGRLTQERREATTWNSQNHL